YSVYRRADLPGGVSEGAGRSGLLSGGRVARLVGTAPGAVSAFRQLPARARDPARRGLRAAHGPDSRGRVTAGSAARDTTAAPSRLAAVIEQPEVRTELGRLSCTEGGWGTLREIQLRALKWQREICTLELVMET